MKHVFVKAAARLNNRAENSHQPTRERERRMRGFRDPKRTQKFLSCFGPIRQHFALKRHLLRASLYRKQLAARFVAWREFAELDILLQKRRDKAAAKRFFKRVLRSSPVPRKIVTDQLHSYPAAKAEIPELANVKHVFVKAAARLNNRAENSHQPTRERERRMRGFRDPKRTQKFLSCFGPIRQHFALKRHLLRASLYRKQLAARFVAWREFAQLAQNPSTAF